MSSVKQDIFAVDSTLYQLTYDVTPISKINYKLLKTPIGKDGAELPKDTPTLNELPSHLQTDNYQVVVIDSVTSGVGRENRDLYGDALKTILDDLKIAHTYIKTESATTITEFAEALDRSKNYTLIVLSGDTSIYEIVDTVLSKNKHESGSKGLIKIALFPQGTGNSLSYGNDILDEVAAINNLLFHDYSEKLPVYKVTFPEDSYEVIHGQSKPVKELHFVCVISTAIHAQLIYEADQPELRKLGHERFKIAVGNVLSQPSIAYKGQALDLNTREKLVDSDEFNYILISAVPYIEKNYAISPDSKVAKNELHLLSFVGFDPQGMSASLLLPYQNGAHLKEKNVKYQTLKNGLIYKLGDEVDERSNICVDGTIIQVKNPKDKEVKIELLDESIFEVDIIGAKK